MSTIKKQIEEADQLADRAEQAYLMADPVASELQNAAEAAHYRVLVCICALTDQEADEIEPAYTKLEKRFLRMPELSGLLLDFKAACH